MHNTNTGFWKRHTLSQYVLEKDGSLTLPVLFLLGVLAAIMHQHFRMGLNIPGHHGLEWMTLLLFGRMQSRHRWAAMVIAGGAVITYMMQTGFLPAAHTSKHALVYLLNGACLDILFRYTPKNMPVVLKGMILGGLSFMAKPIMFLPFAILFEISFGSFSKHGYLYPVLTHFMFGSIGAICGIYLVRLMSRSTKRH